MKNNSSVILFLDDNVKPFGEFSVPINFDLDTTKLVDGDHVLKIVSKDPTGKEGIRKIPFFVRNGPSISVEGISANDTVDGIIPIMINAYGKGDQKTILDRRQRNTTINTSFVLGNNNWFYWICHLLLYC